MLLQHGETLPFIIIYCSSTKTYIPSTDTATANLGISSQSQVGLLLVDTAFSKAFSFWAS